MMLDLASIRLFLLAVDLGSLTRAAEAAGTVQPVVSQRLKALEARLGTKLLERSPRLLRLTASGEAFLPQARALMAAHDAALGFAAPPSARLRLGFSEHAIGLGLEPLLRRLRIALPQATPLMLRTGLSIELKGGFDAGEYDAVVLRREVGAGEGEVVGQDPLGWRATAGFELGPGPLPLATLGPTCGVRSAAVRALEAAGHAWAETCLAGGCAALVAAARAGLGLAPMGRLASGGMTDLGSALGLPPLPASEVVLLGRAASPEVASALRILAASLRAQLRTGDITLF